MFFEMAMQELCFKKSFLNYSPFLSLALLNNWNKNWHKFYYHTSFYLISQVYGWALVGFGGSILLNAISMPICFKIEFNEDEFQDKIRFSFLSYIPEIKIARINSC